MALTGKQREAIRERLASGYGRGRRIVDRDDVAKRYAAGESVKDLAKEYGVQAQTIYHNIKLAIEGK